MKANSILIVGCGDLGVRAGQLWHASGHQLAGVCRNPEHLPDYFTPYRANYCQSGSLSFLQAVAPDYVVATFKPASYSPEGYRQGFPDAVRNLLSGLGSHRPKTIFMVSSTRVFAEQAGGWVGEDSALATSGYAAEAIIEAERLLRASGLSVVIIRFGGIYGALPSRMLTKIQRGEFSAADPVRYSNRIHRDDCAGFLVHLLGLPSAKLAPVYIGVDSEPAPHAEVERWLALQLGVDYCAARTPGDSLPGSKRCRNEGLRESGYKLRYPSYKEGYGALLSAGPNPTEP
jgi:nucleoside-diphosphate-sugar epimerase